MQNLFNEIWNWFEEKDLHDPIPQLNKVVEEVGELAHEINREHYETDEVYDALGDSMITLIGMCHALGADPYICLSEAYAQIKNRRGRIEHGTFIKDE